MTREERIEKMFRDAVHGHTDELLKLLAPDELMEWSGLTYFKALIYLRDSITKELGELEEK